MQISEMTRIILETSRRHAGRVVVTYRYPRAMQSGWRGEFDVEIWDLTTSRIELESALASALPGSRVGAMSTDGKITITPCYGPVQPRREIAAAVHALAVELIGRLDGERSPIAFATRCDGDGAGIEVSR